MVQGRKPNIERHRKAAALRAQGLTLAAIGRALGISHQRVQQILRHLEQQAPARFAACCGCGRAIISTRVLPRDRATALCLPCLAERPETPFGQRLKAFRLAAGLTKAELARRTGLTNSLLRRYECGERIPRSGNLNRLVRVLGKNLSYRSPVATRHSENWRS